MSDESEIRLVDVAAQARDLFGEEAASYIAGRPLPAHEWRFEVVTPNGAQCTFPVDATAADVAGHIERESSR